MTVDTSKRHEFTPTEAKAAISKRWDAAKATESDTRKRYREMPVEEAMEELAGLRKGCEWAALEINQRMNGGGGRGDICGTVFDGDRRKPVQISAKRDPATGVLYNKFYCSILCVQQKNKRDLGLEASIK